MPAATADSAPSLHGIPEVLDLERTEEERVAKALASFSEKESAARRAFDDEMREALANAEAAAEKEIQDYSETELQNILVHGEQDRANQLSALETSYSKHAPAVIDALVDTLSETLLEAKAS